MKPSVWQVVHARLDRCLSLLKGQCELGPGASPPIFTHPSDLFIFLRTHADGLNRADLRAKFTGNTGHGLCQVGITASADPFLYKFKVQAAHRANGDAQAAGHTGFSIDNGLMPIHFFDSLGNLTCWGCDRSIGANPAAGTALNTPLWVNTMNFVALPCDGLGWAWADASLAAAALFGDLISHINPPSLPPYLPNQAP